MAGFEYKGPSSASGGGGIGFAKFSNFSSGGAGSTGGFASFSSFSGEKTGQLSDVEQLIALAQQEGGALGEAVSELTHPERSILATVSNGFKSAFRGFIDVISVPGQVVAGAISSEYSISDAIKKNISPSDVIFGAKNEDATTMQKVGDFLVRTATDVLLDPLTYLSFASAKGILGLTGRTEVSLGKSAAEKAGKKAGDVIALSDPGLEVYTYAKALEHQKTGLARGLNAMEKIAKTEGTEAASQFAQKQLRERLAQGALGKTIIKNAPEEMKGLFEAVSKEMDELARSSINAGLDIDFAKKAITNMLEKNPALLETVMDKGGIKYFGKTILSAQRISAVKQLIPGASWFDEITTPLRNSLAAPFNPALIKVGDTWTRLPQEYVEFERKTKALATALKDERVQKLGNIVRENGLTYPEAQNLLAAVEWGKIPADERLANAYRQLAGFNKGELRFLREKGIPVSFLDNHVPHILLNEDVANTFWKLPPSAKTGALMEQGLAKYVNVATGETKFGTPEGLGFTRKFTAEETGKVLERTREILSRKGLQIKDFEEEIGDLSTFVQDVFQGKVTKEFKDAIGNMPITDRENIQQFINVMKSQMGTLDVERLVSTYGKKAYKEGTRITQEAIEGAVSGLSKEGIAALKARLKQGEEWLKGPDIALLNDALKKAEKNAIQKGLKKTKTVAGAGDKEALELMKKLKLESAAKRGEYIAENMNGRALAALVQSLKEQFEANPDGVKNILDRIIGKKQKITDLLSEIQLEKQAAARDLSSLPQAKQFFVDSEGNAYKRVKASISELKENGFDIFDDNLVTALAARTIDNVKAGVSSEFMRDLARQFGVPASEAPTGYRSISLKGVSGEAEKILNTLGIQGEELVFHPAIAKRVEEFVGSVINDDATEGFLKAFDSLQNAWKASVTATFPAFHGRNAISNVFLNFLDLGYHVLNPATHSMASSVVYADRRLMKLEQAASGVGQAAEAAKNELSEMLQKKMFTDVTGYEWTLGEIRDTLRRNNVAFSADIMGSVDITRSRDDMIHGFFFADESLAKKAKRKANPLSQEFVPYEWGKGVGKAIEEQARLVNFITNLQNTGDVGLAINRTRQFLFDYSNITPFEKTVLKRMMPFYTFTRKNLELQARTLLTQPGRISAEVTAITTLGEVWSGAQLTDEERNALPEWVRSGLSVPIKKKGKDVEVLGSLNIPIEAAFDVFNVNKLASQITPILRTPVEIGTGYSIFQGKPFSEITNAVGFRHAPNALKEFIGYTEVTTKDRKTGEKRTSYISLRPERMALINNAPITTRLLTSIRQLENANMSESGKIFQQLFGTRIYSFDLEQEQARRELEMRTKIEKLLNDAKVTAQFKQTYKRRDRVTE